MKNNYHFLATAMLLLTLSIAVTSAIAQQAHVEKVAIKKPLAKITPGAARTGIYLELLAHKRVGIIMNQASTIGNTLLVDSLLKLKVNVVKLFAPEHGIRGTADAGESIANGIDTKTKLPIISLYGNHKQPTKADLADIDVLLFDLQDVGVRFYTYVGTLHYVMLAAALNEKELIVLDRPNPNGYYCDGPMPDKNFTPSFVCMHPVPVVHGLTIGEYAQLINGEHWLVENDPSLNKNVGDDLYCNLTVIPCLGYNHRSRYNLPIKPSPNLPDMKSVYYYPSLCWFEGTVISLGRGTDKPFQQFGHPDLKGYSYSFTPKSTTGAKEPPCKDKTCFGKDLSTIATTDLAKAQQLNLDYLLEAYRNFPAKAHFFTPFFSTLAGGKTLQQQIEKGMTADQIRATWQNDLNQFNLLRKKYALYGEM